MATKSQGRLWQLCQVLLLATGATSLNCNLLHHQQSKFNQYSLQLLQNMGGPFPLECLEHRTAFRFPEMVLKHKGPQHAQMAVHEMLLQLFSIFSRNRLETGWGKSNVELFLNGLASQTGHLETCLHTKGGLQILRLKRYFQKIKDFLAKEQDSTCAWETVRLEAQRCFLYIDKLTVMMNTQVTNIFL